MTSNTVDPIVEGPVRLTILEQGAVWKLSLATPKGNILDAAKNEILRDTFARLRHEGGVKAVILEGEGPHFSFGASIDEHMPDHVARMLTGFHGVFGAMLAARVVTIAVVRGQCLGGGLELASFCQRLFASPDARFGQPEIKLGVIAPVASVFLPERIGRANAEDLCLTGRTIAAMDALSMRLVDEVALDPGLAASEWIRTHLLPLSASSLRHAVECLRAPLAARFAQDIERAERQYLDRLMRTHDAVEGLQAYVEKRQPKWRNA
jgi:cyclohexa-1,5-dienecarbonyl-CoA hydratase